MADLFDITRTLRERGYREDEIRKIYQDKGYAPTDILTGMRPSGAVLSGGGTGIEEISTPDFLGATAARHIAGPFVGLGEMTGLVEEGTLAELEEQHRRKREDWLAGGRGVTPAKALLAGASEIGAAAAPIFPGGAAGKLVTKALKPASRLARAGTAAIPGAVEGGLVGLGESQVNPDATVWERMLSTGVGAVAGAGGGAIGGGLFRGVGPELRIGGKTPTPENVDLDTIHGDLFVDDEAAQAGLVDRIAAGLRRTNRRIRQEMIDELDPLERVARRGDEVNRPLLALINEGRVANQTSTAPIDRMTRRYAGLEKGFEQTNGRAVVDYDPEGNKILRWEEGSDEVMTDIVGDLDPVMYDRFESYAALKRFRDDLVTRNEWDAMQMGAQDQAAMAKSHLDELKKELKELDRKSFQAPSRKTDLEDPRPDRLKNELFPRTKEKTRAQWRALADERRAEIKRLSKGQVDLDKAALTERTKQRQAEQWLTENQDLINDRFDQLSALERAHGADFADRFERLKAWQIRAHLEPLRAVGAITDADMIRILEANENYITYTRRRAQGLAAQDEFVPDPDDLVDEILAREGIDVGTGDVRTGAGGRPKQAPLFKIKSGLADDLDPVLDSAAMRAIEVDRFAKQQALRNEVGRLHDDGLLDELVEVDLKKQKPGKPREGEFDAYIDGVKRRFKGAKGSGVVQALEGLNPDQMRWVRRALAVPTRLVRAGATLSPEFPARNWFRDQFALGTYSKNNALPFISPIKSMMENKGLLGKKAQEAALQYAKEFEASTRGSTWLAGDIQQSQQGRTVRELVTSGGRQFAPTANPGKWTLNRLRQFSDALEKNTRMAEFKLSRRAGKSVSEAAYDAADVTLNFARAGRTGRVLNGAMAFFNAEMQDIDKFGRALITEKGNRLSTAAKAAAYFTGPAIAHAYMHRDDDHYHRNIPKWEKAVFFHIPKNPIGALMGEDPELRSDGRYWRVPRALGLMNLAFGLTTEAGMNAILRDPDPLESPGRLLLEQAHQATPAHYIGGPFGVSPDVSPTALQPMMEIAANYDSFRDSPLESYAQQGNVPENRVGPNTSATAEVLAMGMRSAAKKVSTVLGQAPWLANYLTNTSPVMVDHLINSYGSTLGQGAMALLDPASQSVLEASGMKGGDQLPEDPLKKPATPFLRGAISSSAFGMGSEPVRHAYDLFEQASQANRALTQWEEMGDPRAATAYEEYPLLEFYDEIMQAKTELAELRQWRKEATTQEEALALDQEITALAYSLVYDVSEGLLAIQGVTDQ